MPNLTLYSIQILKERRSQFHHFLVNNPACSQLLGFVDVEAYCPGVRQQWGCQESNDRWPATSDEQQKSTKELTVNAFDRAADATVGGSSENQWISRSESTTTPKSQISSCLHIIIADMNYLDMGNVNFRLRRWILFPESNLKVLF